MTLALHTTVRPPGQPAGENLARFSFHTGHVLRRLDEGEGCPILFRDIGLEAMSRFLRGTLYRLCGPTSPITYLRTADYCEPYSDFGRIGRVMLLRPLDVEPWHSGIETIYIASCQTFVEPESMVFVPSDVSLSDAESRFAGVSSRTELVDAFGNGTYAECCSETLARLDTLQRSHAESERLAASLRRMFQSHDQRARDQARERMQQVGLTETDLCTAWHHLSDARRGHIQAALRELEAIRC